MSDETRAALKFVMLFTERVTDEKMGAWQDEALDLSEPWRTRACALINDLRRSRIAMEEIVRAYDDAFPRVYPPGTQQNAQPTKASGEGKEST